jgi:hypothetical protein
VYLAESACEALNADERRLLDRFRSIGIVRSLGSVPPTLRVQYPDGFADEKQSPGGVAVSVLVTQPLVTPLPIALERKLRAGDVAAARDLEARYRQFLEDLWRYGVSHLDFSILNVGIAGSGEGGRLQIFDPHMGVIEVAGGNAEVQDPLAARPPGNRSLEDLLRAARDGSRWALWRIQQDAAASSDVPDERAAAAAEVVRDFHIASSRIGQGQGAFSVSRFDRTWQQRGAHGINPVLHAELWTLFKHPLCELVQSILEEPGRDAIHDRALTVSGIHDDRPLAQFRAGSAVHRERPLLVVANVLDEGPRLVKHWGRLRCRGKRTRRTTWPSITTCATCSPARRTCAPSRGSRSPRLRFRPCSVRAPRSSGGRRGRGRYGGRESARGELGRLEVSQGLHETDRLCRRRSR